MFVINMCVVRIMELVHGTHKASKFTSEDFISNMPDNVVTSILDRLPLQDTVRTSILARNWRFYWTMLSQLVLDKDFFKYLLEKEGEKCYRRIISRLILDIKGAITKFSLCINKEVLDDEDIKHWFLLLSRKGVKDVTLISEWHRLRFKLPTHLFSCLELKHLDLYRCYFNPPRSFHGFPNLLSLKLSRVQFESRKLGDFFTLSPVLEILNLDFNFPAGKAKVDEIAKLANLKTLSLVMFNFRDTMITSCSSILELVGSLPKLQELDLNFLICKPFTVDVARKRSPKAFLCLKALKLGNGILLSCALELIRCFPNLQTLEITSYDCDVVPIHTICSPQLDYNTTGLLQLQSVTLEYMKGSESEVCLIKYLLACSPFLKKIVIRPNSLIDIASDEKLEFTRKLLKLHRASSVAEIDLF
ncbi:F-box/FBD/LRR-repeat protein At1g13570-like [Bidens hawaiensis]|uniref:F-box/FBD/LRR-repeat protein At1g13570-like n=1 Tax=Bidens hawaiensis TaxID=980011 RepID=UPI0040499D47